MSPSQPKVHRRHRRAAAMALALVVLLIVGLVSGLTLQAILRSHRQVRDEEQRVQAEMLADSALRRALALLRKDTAWGGETWTVSLGAPGQEARDASQTGVATIRVEKTAAKDQLQLDVTAIYPNDPVHRDQAEREMTYTIPPPGAN